MAKALSPGTILVVGSLAMATLMAIAVILLGCPGDALRAALVGGLFGFVLFAGVAWAVRPAGRPVPETLGRVERFFRRLGILGAAGYAACVWLDRPGPLLVAAFCAAFAGFFIAALAEIRLDVLKPPPGSSDIPLS